MINRKSDNPRLLLAKLRQADYTHAGDEEAIDIVLERINKLITLDKSKKVLDVGCGLGGTADYIRKKSAINVYGIDIDATAIKHARQRYPEVEFLEGDVMQIDKIYIENRFDLIYLFNVFYALPDQQASLEKLAAVANNGAILAIFDYTQTKPDSIGLTDLADKPMKPIYLENIKKWLKAAGWELIEIVDLSSQYDKWYSSLLEKLKSQKNNLLNEFTESAYEKVLTTFSFLSNKIKDKEMGGSVVCAKNSNIKTRSSKF